MLEILPAVACSQVPSRFVHRTLFYPKQGSNEFYQKLKKQCLNLSIPEIGTGTDKPQEAFKRALSECDVVMDAIFGFSFKGEPRAPFDCVIAALKETDKPILSVDIPSAWDVEEGNVNGRSFNPGRLWCRNLQSGRLYQRLSSRQTR